MDLNRIKGKCFFILMCVLPFKLLFYIYIFFAHKLLVPHSKRHPHGTSFQSLTLAHKNTQRTNFISVLMPRWAFCLVSLQKIAIFLTVMAAQTEDVHLFPSKRHKQIA